MWRVSCEVREAKGEEEKGICEAPSHYIHGSRTLLLFLSKPEPNYLIRLSIVFSPTFAFTACPRWRLARALPLGLPLHHLQQRHPHHRMIPPIWCAVSAAMVRIKRVRLCCDVCSRCPLR